MTPEKPKRVRAYERQLAGVAMMRATRETRDEWLKLLQTARSNTRSSHYYSAPSRVGTIDELLYVVARALLYDEWDELNGCFPDGVKFSSTRIPVAGPGGGIQPLEQPYT